MYALNYITYDQKLWTRCKNIKSYYQMYIHLILEQQTLVEVQEQSVEKVKTAQFVWKFMSAISPYLFACCWSILVGKYLPKWTCPLLMMYASEIHINVISYLLPAYHFSVWEWYDTIKCTVVHTIVIKSSRVSP